MESSRGEGIEKKTGFMRAGGTTHGALTPHSFFFLDPILLLARIQTQKIFHVRV